MAKEKKKVDYAVFSNERPKANKVVVAKIRVKTCSPDALIGVVQSALNAMKDKGIKSNAVKGVLTFS